MLAIHAAASRFRGIVDQRQGLQRDRFAASSDNAATEIVPIAIHRQAWPARIEPPKSNANTWLPE